VLRRLLMPPRKNNAKASGGLPDNALAKQAMDTIKQIEREAQDKKLQQLESLKTARITIMERISELQHQLTQLDKAMEAITGHAPAGTGERRERRNLEEVRQRVARWMEGRR